MFARLRRPDPAVAAPSVIVEDAAMSVRRLRNIELTARRIGHGILNGIHDTAAIGSGTERGDARSYNAGDDVRHIDWMASARTGETHVRDTLAERELRVTVVVDASRSMRFGSQTLTKYEFAVAVAGAICIVGAVRHDQVGVQIAGHSPQRMPGELTRPPLGAFVGKALSVEAPDVSTLEQALWAVGRTSRGTQLIIVCSDLLGDGWQTPLRALAARAGVVVVEPFDVLERSLVAAGITEFSDGSSSVWVDTDDAQQRERFERHAAANATARAEQVASCGAQHVAVCVESPVDMSLLAALRAVTGGVR